MSKCVTTKLENRTRKNWFFSTLFILVLYPLVDLAISSILSLSSIPKETFTDLPLKVIVGVIQTIFLWHCAYRNHGTKLLSFYVVALPLLLIISMVTSLTDSSSISSTTDSNSSKVDAIATSLIGLTAFFWWLILSLKMKNINMAIQERALEGKLQSN